MVTVPAGDYTLTVFGLAGSGATGAYSFRFSDLATATAFTPGTAVNGTLSPAYSTNLYQFSGSAGQSIYIARLSGSGGSPGDRLRLIDPYGNVLSSVSLGLDTGRLTLRVGGIYTVLVGGTNGDTGTTNYTFNVFPISDPTHALTLGSVVSANLAVPGEQDRYTFNLADDTQLYFDSLINNVNFQWSLTGPSGITVNNLAFNSSDGHFGVSNPVMSVPAGAYTLTVDATGSTTGPYAFRLSNLATATALTPGTAVSDSLSPANSTNLYQFSAAAGQSFYFARLSGTATSAQWRLIDPDGNVLFSTLLNTDAGRLTLTAAGTYTLLVEGFISETGTVNYSFNVAPITDTTQVLTLGSLVNATLAAPGEQDHYTFNLSASSQLYFDSLTNNANLQWSLERPTGGTAVNNVTFAASDGFFGPSDPVLSLPAGAYILTVAGSGQTTGAYSFRLSDLATATLLTPGTAVSGTLAPANSTNLSQFSAAAGQAFYFARLSSSAGNTSLRLIDPYGNSLVSTGLSTDAGRVILKAAGTYTVLVEGFISDTVTVHYSFNVAPITDTTQGWHWEASSMPPGRNPASRTAIRSIWRPMPSFISTP